MNILFLSLQNIEFGSGPERSILELSKYLALRHKVTIATTDAGQKHTRISGQLTKLGIDVKQLQTSRLLPNFLTFNSLRKLIKMIRKADIVYFVYMGVYLKVVTVLMQMIIRTPIVAGHHATLLNHPHDHYHTSILSLISYKLNSSSVFLCKFYSANHVLNTTDESILRSYGVKDTFLIPLGVDVSIYCPSKKYSKFSIVFLGRLDYQKGSDILAVLWSGIKEFSNSIDMYVIGDGDYRKDIEALSADPRVKWSGYLEEREKVEILSHSHLLISPSRHEGFPLSVLEALACGTPVISFAIPGPTETVICGKNGYIVESIPQFVSQVFSVFNKWSDNLGYDELCINAKESATKFSWSAISLKIEEMLVSVVSK